MNTRADVNFIPDDVAQSQYREGEAESITKVSIIIVVAFILIGILLLLYNLYVGRKINNNNKQIQEKQEIISELTEFGKSGYKLGIRLSAVKEILSNRIYFSAIMEEISKQKPDSVEIIGWQVQNDGELVLNGRAHPNYAPVAEFQNNLADSPLKLFNEVHLTSAALNSESGDVEFSLQLRLKPEVKNEETE